MSEALQMADELDRLGSQYDSEIAAELRRLCAELERKSDAIQRLWKERDELRALNAELAEALRWIDKRCPSIMLEQPLHKVHAESAYDAGWRARAALSKMEASK